MIPAGLSEVVVAFLRGELGKDVDAVDGLAEDFTVEDLVFGTCHGRAQTLSWWRTVLTELPHEMTVERVDRYERVIAVTTVVRGATNDSRFAVPRLTVAAVREDRVLSMRNAWNDPRRATCVGDRQVPDAR